MTPQQLKLIHVARRQLGLEDDEYRDILRNLGGVDSSKKLTRHGFERVMAHFELRGFRHAGVADYWRSRHGRRASGMITPEQLHEIEQLAAACPYPVSAMIRTAAKRERAAEQLSAKEARSVIEAMKATVRRAGGAAHSRKPRWDPVPVPDVEEPF